MIEDAKEIRVYNNPWSDSISFLLKDGAAVATEIIFETPRPGIQLKPNFELSNDAAQRLMDGLWNCGLRPSEGSGSAGMLAATERHLEDFRKLVFKGDYQPTKR